jgi:26S proteasome regulatory subunit N1
MIETVRVVDHKIGKYAEITLQSCAYAGSGNVLKIQSMLHICAEHLTENAEHQAVAVLGIGLISIGEDIGTDMTLRTFEHLLHYGELPVKRVVPLAIALLYISNPDYGIIDQLSRLSHDQDPELSQAAIFGLGLVSAGCNNSRVSGLLRQLSEFYSTEANHLFAVRIAQGLNCLGKGLTGLSPFHSDRLLMNASGMIGILTVLHACFDMKGTIFDKFHYLLYFLTTSMNPRILQTVDENLTPVPQTVRVGLAVETVGQAGRPKTITGFQVIYLINIYIFILYFFIILYFYI